MNKFFKICLLVILSYALFIFNIKADSKVKVYVFSAGDCPYCERQIEYLKKLKSYNKKFEIIEKELYVDHIEWQPGKDYELGKQVGEAFKKSGYKDSTYEATPLVIVGNSYAASGYNDSLSSVINKAYKKRTIDIVECFQNNSDDCESKIVKKNPNKKAINIDPNLITLIIFAVLGIVYAIKKLKKK